MSVISSAEWDESRNPQFRKCCVFFTDAEWDSLILAASLIMRPATSLVVAAARAEASRILAAAHEGKPINPLPCPKRKRGGNV